jgi:two-component system KDP operon response regulator KdpE
VKGVRVLVVDDEPQLLRALRTTLEGSGYAVDTAESGEAALTAISIRAPDVILLDLVLPDMRGTDVCREVRRFSAVPIVLVSAVDEEVEKIAALDAGADDYITKPFAIGELLARLRAVLRRTIADGEPVIEVGSLRIDLEKHLVTVDGRSVHLTPHEFDVLALLARHKGKLMTQRAILTEVWGAAYQQESSYLHVYVSQLRRKLEPDPARPRYLLTETGVGYRLVEPEAASATTSQDRL